MLAIGRGMRCRESSWHINNLPEQVIWRGVAAHPNIEKTRILTREVGEDCIDCVPARDRSSEIDRGAIRRGKLRKVQCFSKCGTVRTSGVASVDPVPQMCKDAGNDAFKIINAVP
jgi:hypothetical protein